MADRATSARARRREQARETLELERTREAELREELEELRGELDAARVDAEAFAAMSEEDVELVREAMGDSDGHDDDALELGEDWSDDEIELGGDDETGEAGVGDYGSALAAEIERLELELADSARTQLALQRYLDVLDGVT